MVTQYENKIQASTVQWTNLSMHIFASIGFYDLHIYAIYVHILHIDELIRPVYSLIHEICVNMILWMY